MLGFVIIQVYEGQRGPLQTPKGVFNIMEAECTWGSITLVRWQKKSEVLESMEMFYCGFCIRERVEQDH